MGNEGDAALRELQSQALLIDSLKKAGAHYSVYLKDRALDAEDLVGLQEPFVWFVWFVDHFSSALAAFQRQEQYMNITAALGSRCVPVAQRRS